jgi:hypothetical protein
MPRLGILLHVLLLVELIFLGGARSVFAEELEFEPHADIRLTGVGFPDNPSPVVNSELGIGNLQLPTELRLGPTMGLKIRPEFQVDPWNNSISERYWAELPEGYLQLKPLRTSALVIQLGFNTFTWGVTDGYNPLDIASIRRYEDPLFPEKLGAPALSAHYEIPGGHFSIDGIYIPYQRRAILPGQNSRWLPRELFQSEAVNFNGQGATIELPQSVYYNYGTNDILDNSQQNNFGFRAEGHFTSLDLSLIYFNGEAPLPATDVSLSLNVVAITPNNIVIAADPAITITPVYYRQHVFGGSAVYALGEFIFRAETAFTRVISKRADLPSLTNEYVGEVEHAFNIGSGTLTAFLEGTYAQHSEAIDPSLVSLIRMFDRAAVVGARYAPNQTMLAGLFLLDDTEYHGQLYRFELSDSLTDAIKVIGTGEVFRGEPGTPIGTYRYNSLGSLSLQYSL